jgi:hypothetical protein
MKYINNTIFVRAGEDISKGDLVTIVDDSGQKAYRADSENARPAMGFAVYNIASGATGKIVLGGGLIQDMTDINGDPLAYDGTPYYLAGGDSPDGKGKISDTRGTLVQFIGYAIKDDCLMFVISLGT